MLSTTEIREILENVIVITDETKGKIKEVLIRKCTRHIDKYTLTLNIMHQKDLLSLTNVYLTHFEYLEQNNKLTMGEIELLNMKLNEKLLKCYTIGKNMYNEEMEFKVGDTINVRVGKRKDKTFFQYLKKN